MPELISRMRRGATWTLLIALALIGLALANAASGSLALALAAMFTAGALTTWAGLSAIAARLLRLQGSDRD